MNRRELIKMSFIALSAAAAVKSSRLLMADQKETIQWDQFIDTCRELSDAQFEDSWDQEVHTKQVESLLNRLRLTEEQRAKFLSRYANRIPDFPEISHLHYERRFMISLVEFEKGDVIPLHDHPDMTGVVLCIEGRVDVQHFDKLKETSHSNRPLLQEERSVQMEPGDIATLTKERGNIHTLQALEFTRMIDVFTPPYDPDRIQRALYYQIEPTVYEGREGVFEVVSSSNSRN